MSSVEPHIIRLAGPWEVQPEAGLHWFNEPEVADTAAPRRIKLPVSWQELFGQRAGSARFMRSFNSPTGLSDERLFVVCQQPRCRGEMWLNGCLLGTFTAEEERPQVEITSQLQLNNRLELVLVCESVPAETSPETSCGLGLPVLLEIHPGAG